MNNYDIFLKTYFDIISEATGNFKIKDLIIKKVSATSNGKLTKDFDQVLKELNKLTTFDKLKEKLADISENFEKYVIPSKNTNSNETDEDDDDEDDVEVKKEDDKKQGKVEVGETKVKEQTKEEQKPEEQKPEDKNN